MIDNARIMTRTSTTKINGVLYPTKMCAKLAGTKLILWESSSAPTQLTAGRLLTLILPHILSLAYQIRTNDNKQ